MECVKTKEELFALTSDEIAKRLDDFSDVAYEELWEENWEETISQEELQCADRYLERALFFMNKFMRRKDKDTNLNSTCHRLAKATAFGYDNLSPIMYRRCYQKALLLWKYNSDLMLGRRINLPKELDDNNITYALAQFIGNEIDGSQSEIELLEQAVQKAKEHKDEAMANKIMSLIAWLTEVLSTYEKVNKDKGVQRRFLEHIANFLKHYSLGKVAQRGNRIELKTNDPRFPFNLKSLPNGSEATMDTLNEMLAAFTTFTANQMGINNDKMELKHTMSSYSPNCIIITFSLIDKK